MGFYEVTVRQRYFDQLCINVFNYFTSLSVGVTPNSLELLTLMGFIPTGDPLDFPADTLAWHMAEQQNAGVEYLTAEARELYSVTDFYEAVYSPALIGHLTSGEAMSPLAAYGVFSNRVRTDIRRGFKRFVGVSEGQIGSGGVLASGALGGVTAIADAMSASLTGAAAVYFPCVISRLKEAYTEGGVTKYRYVLYPTPEEQEDHTAVGVTYAAYTTMRSQTSRQYGRGQ